MNSPAPMRIVRKMRETADTTTLVLDAPGFRFAPGQFNMLYAFGVGESAISVSGDPTRDGQLVHTIRAVGAVTHRLCSLKRGDSVGIRGPFGVGWPLDAALGRDVLVIAGGLGLAPLRPVVYELARRRGEFGKVSLLYGTRTPDDLLFDADLRRWAKRIQVLVTVDRATRETWTGHVGVASALLSEAAFDPRRTTAMICGPELMMRFTVRDLERRGIAQRDIYVSMERNMKCAVGLCGHCQYNFAFVCKDGPVFSVDRIAHVFERREI